MRIFIVSYTYWPDVQPRSIRWQSLANYWANNGHTVTVLTASQPEIINAKENKNIEIIHVPENWFGRLRKKLSRPAVSKTKDQIVVSLSNKDNQQKRALITIIVKKCIQFSYNLLIKKIQWPDYAWTWVMNARREALKHLTESKNYDVMISVSHPFSSHLIGRAVKSKFPKLKWILDMGDPFCFLTQSPPNNFLLFDRLNQKIEGSCFNESNGIVVTTKETKDEYLKYFFDTESKINVIPPLLSNEVSSLIRSKEQRNKKNNCIKLVFIGTLYSGIRHPSGLLKLLNAASSDVSKKIEMHFFGPENDVDTSLLNFPNISIFFHGHVTREIALEQMLDSDFLVSIGNATKFQLPSKLIEYASTGKPILNISSIKNDSSSAFLSSYPFAKTFYVNNRISEEMIKELAGYLNKEVIANKSHDKVWLNKHQTHNIAREYEILFS
tara:strand:+ start:379 stop:1698 length:1320 start_codon:yes stop_codon:yes gene_type:complete